MGPLSLIKIPIIVKMNIGDRTISANNAHKKSKQRFIIEYILNNIVI